MVGNVDNEVIAGDSCPVMEKGFPTAIFSHHLVARVSTMSTTHFYDCLLR